MGFGSSDSEKTDLVSPDNITAISPTIYIVCSFGFDVTSLFIKSENMPSFL